MKSSQNVKYPAVYDGCKPPESGTSRQLPGQQNVYEMQMASLDLRHGGPYHHCTNCGTSYGCGPQSWSTQQVEDFYSQKEHLLSQQQQAHALHVHHPHNEQPPPPHPSPDAGVLIQHELPGRNLREQGQQETGSRGQVTDDVDMEDASGGPGGHIQEVANHTTSPGLDNSAHPSAKVTYGGSASEYTETQNLVSGKSTSHQGGYDHQAPTRNNRPAGAGGSSKKPGVVESIVNMLKQGSTHDSNSLQDSTNAETFHVREGAQESGNWRKEKLILTEELRRKEGELSRKMKALNSAEGELFNKNDEVKRTVDAWRAEKSRVEEMRKQQEQDLKIHNSTVTNLTAKVTEYQALAEKLTKQILSYEQANSKQAGGTGAHKDSHAIPPNLVKAATVVDQAALSFTNKFVAFLKERNAFKSHPAVASALESGQGDQRYCKYALEALICRRMFAGFENDCYMDNLDCVSASPYLPPDHENVPFFLHHQDLEQRYEHYLVQYESVQKMGLQGIMDVVKTMNEPESRLPFVQFCCTKLVSVLTGVDSFSKEVFASFGNHPREQVFLLQQLALDAAYCDKLLKPFVNLAMAAFLLHRLAFQFNPPARIFRYAKGAHFDPLYMQNAFPSDDDVSNEKSVVGLMLIPGFQVGATIIKCKVYLVPLSTPA